MTYLPLLICVLVQELYGDSVILELCWYAKGIVCASAGAISNPYVRFKHDVFVENAGKPLPSSQSQSEIDFEAFVEHDMLAIHMECARGRSVQDVQLMQ